MPKSERKVVFPPSERGSFSSSPTKIRHATSAPQERIQRRSSTGSGATRSNTIQPSIFVPNLPDYSKSGSELTIIAPSVTVDLDFRELCTERVFTPMNTPRRRSSRAYDPRPPVMGPTISSGLENVPAVSSSTIKAAINREREKASRDQRKRDNSKKSTADASNQRTRRTKPVVAVLPSGLGDVIETHLHSNSLQSRLVLPASGLMPADPPLANATPMTSSLNIPPMLSSDPTTSRSFKSQLAYSLTRNFDTSETLTLDSSDWRDAARHEIHRRGLNENKVLPAVTPLFANTKKRKKRKKIKENTNKKEDKDEGDEAFGAKVEVEICGDIVKLPDGSEMDIETYELALWIAERMKRSGAHNDSDDSSESENMLANNTDANKNL